MRCLTPLCWRTVRKHGPLCGACRKLVPKETLLALDGHFDAHHNWWLYARNLGHAETDPNHLAQWFAFVRWSFDETWKLAAAQVYEIHRVREEERYWAATTA